MITKRKHTMYDREFKIQAVKLLEKGGSTMSQIAKDLGVNINTLSNWRKIPIFARLKDGYISLLSLIYARGKLLDTRGIVQSMSGRGNCYDNTPAESFFKTLKTEEVYWRTYYTREEAKNYLFKYIEGFYNTTRLHSSLEYQSPQEFEMNYKMGRINDVA